MTKRSVTAGQRVVLRALEQGRNSVGTTPGALGRIVASLYDRDWVGDLAGWSITQAGIDALRADEGERS